MKYEDLSFTLKDDNGEDITCDILSVVPNEANLDEPYVVFTDYMLDEDDEGDWSTISQVLLDAEKFRMKLINEYIKYLGRQYRSISIEKLGLIIEELRKMRSKAYSNYLGTNDRGRKSR